MKMEVDLPDIGYASAICALVKWSFSGPERTLTFRRTDQGARAEATMPEVVSGNRVGLSCNAMSVDQLRELCAAMERTT